MSAKGIHACAKILGDMQLLRIKLIRGDAEDMRLGLMLENAKTVMAPVFSRITSDTKTNQKSKADAKRRQNKWA